MAERGTSQDIKRKRLTKVHSPTGDSRGRDKSGHRKKRVSDHKTSDKQGDTDMILVTTFFQQQVTVQMMVWQLTQNDGKAAVHVFITFSVLTFPCSKLR